MAAGLPKEGLFLTSIEASWRELILKGVRATKQVQ